MLKRLTRYSPYIGLDNPFSKYQSLGIVQRSHQWLITAASIHAIFLLGLLSNNGICAHSEVTLDRISDSAAYDSRDKWLAEYLADKDRTPFSFRYDGMKSIGLLKDWHFSSATKSLSSEKTQIILTYSDPKKAIEVRCEAIVFEHHPSVEWIIRFKNTGQIETAIISDVMSLHTRFTPLRKDTILHYTKGVGEGVSAHSSDLAPVKRILRPNSEFATTPMHGRPSWGESLPFFNIETKDAESREGLIVAIGWTGQWNAIFKHQTDSVILQAGMEGTHLKLYPGEEIRTPKIMLLFWRHHQFNGQNLLRRMILKHYHPQKDGKPLTVPFLASSAGLYNEAFNATEENQIQFAAQFAKLGVEYLWLDVGWHDSSNGHSHLGPIDRSRFPNGFKPLTDKLKALNMGLLTWNAPEFLGGNSWIEHEFPELLLRPRDPQLDPKNPLFSILNFGDKNALALITDHTTAMIKKEGIGIYRQDGPIGANLEYAHKQPLKWWQDNDEVDRQGITQIRYVEGLYEFWDRLREENPELIIDLCGGGATRIDIEAMSRCVYLWRSDNNHPGFEPEGFQSQTIGVSQWIPSTGTASGYPDTYSFRSSINNGSTIAWNPYQPEVEQNWSLAFPVRQKHPYKLKKVVRKTVDGKNRVGYVMSEPFPWDQARRLAEEFHRIRHYYYEDFYPLTPHSTSDEVWMAFQFHSENDNSGIIMAFRRSQCIIKSKVVKLWGLKESSRYEVHFEDQQRKEIFSGNELRASLNLSIDEPRKSQLITYREVESKN